MYAMTSFPFALRCLTAVAALLVAASSPAQAPLGNWPFDEGQGELVRTADGKGPEGHITGARWADGRSGKALEFQGPDLSGPARPPGSFVRLAGSEGMNPARRLEVSAAVLPSAYPLGWAGIVEKGSGYGASFRLLLLRSGHVRIALGAEHLALDSPAPIPLGKWTVLRAVFDGKLLRLLIDDKPVAETKAVPKSLTSNHPIEFGRRLTGKLDDVRIVY